MRLNAIVVVMACGVVCASVYAYPPIYSDEPPAAYDSGGNDDDGGGYAIPQLNVGYAQQHREHNKPSGTYFATSKTTLTSTTTSAAAAEPISAATTTSGKLPLQPAFVYNAQVPAHIEPETNNVVNAVKLASSTVAAASPSSSSYQLGYTNTYQSTNLNDNADQDGHLSKTPNGSSAASSVAVILNGDQPEFTDALGQKVPKPQPSLQVASPINLLNPDRYEFYTFDEYGELVKRLMTMEEIQSIVANGDGEGPTIIHHGPVEDRDPEKNVQDIVNSVQDVLNKEVESNKNTTSNILPILDTPDVSSSWSMILPAIFGNTGGIDISPQHKPQQIVMTPDTEIIEMSTKEAASTTTTKPKPSKRKPGQKRKPSSTTTTTEMAPQVIQEELDSHESVYTGMQQYQHLAATMHNYDGFSQMHMQPIYHKLPEHLHIETTTKRVFINNEEVVQKPSVDATNLSDNPARKRPSVQNKPLPPHRVKKPSGGQTTTKRPHSTKQKIKRKPTTTTSTTTTAPDITTEIQPTSTTTQPTSTTTQPTSTTTQPTSTTTQPTTTTTQPTTTTTQPTTTTTQATTTPQPATTTQQPTTTTTTSTEPTVTTTTTEAEATITTSTQISNIPLSSTTHAPKKKKKKPTRQPIHTSSSADGSSSVKPHISGEKRKPTPKPHRHRPKPTQYTTLPPDLTAEGSAHQEVSNNKYQHVSHSRPRPKPHKPTATSKTTTTRVPTTTPIPSTTVVFSPIPIPTVPTPQESSLIVEDFPGYEPTKLTPPTRATTETTRLSTTTTSISTSSGTSGYPVPTYGSADDISEEQNMNQFKKKPLPSLAMIQHADSKPFDQDIHTMQSFDQIMQSLKQPELPQNIDVHKTDSHSTQVKPVKYDSAENMDQLEEMANKHMIPVLNSMIDKTTTTTPLYTHHGGNIVSTISADIDTTTDTSSVPSEETTVSASDTTTADKIIYQPQFSVTTNQPQDITTSLPTKAETITIESTNSAPLHDIEDITTNIPVGEESTLMESTTTALFDDITTKTVGITDIAETTEQLSEESSETTIPNETTRDPLVDQDSLYVQEPQTVLHELTTEAAMVQPQFIYGETTTNSDERYEETTIQGQSRLPVAAPQKQHTTFMDDDRETYTQPILVADLKPQLNMEVLKPTYQISMSDFQTQAATVASTLVDGSNTVAVDNSMMSSNETKDEIAFLMSDVIKLISNDEHSANPEKTILNSNHHYSNNPQTVSQPTQANIINNGQGISSSTSLHASDNRYSNVAKLNASFLMPYHDENINQSGFLSSYGNQIVNVKIDPKPIYERLEDSSVLDDEYSATVKTEITATTRGEIVDTRLDYTTQLPDTPKDVITIETNKESSSLEDIISTTTSPEQEPQLTQDYTINALQLEKETTAQSFEMIMDKGDSDTNTSTKPSEEDDSTTPKIFATNEATEETTTYEAPVPSLSQIYAQQQQLEDNADREALYESDSSIDTTTEINNLSEETTETQWQTSSEETKTTEILEPMLNETTHVVANDEYGTEVSAGESGEQHSEESTTTEGSMEYIEATTVVPKQIVEEDISDISAMETATIKVESTEGQQDITNIENSTETISSTTISSEESTIESEEHTQSQTVEDNETNDTKLEHITEIVIQSTTLKDEGDSQDYSKTESDEITVQEITTQLPLSTEESTDKSEELQSVTEKGEIEITTQNYQMSEETSEELNAMISEEDETDEFVDEDPYIKLGETTTTKPIESSTIQSVQSSKVEFAYADRETQSIEKETKVEVLSQNQNSKPNAEDNEHMLAPPKPIAASVDNDMPTGTHTILQTEIDSQTFEGSDEEDEDDQIGYQAPKLPTSSSSTTPATVITTTTPKPTSTTTRRLNTLKPVSYFNKQPAYALYKDPVEPLYNKQPSYPSPLQQQDNVHNKVMTYSIPPAQQRPMQRPPQLSNLMISSTQATRPPVKLEPSPNSSKGLEASLADLDEDILAFARLCNELAFSYWKSITSEKISSTRSLVISPFALTSMLSMVFLGARGSTSGEMNDVLKLDDMVTFNPHLVFKNITDSVERAMDSDIATTAFVREVFSDRANGKILQFFKEKTQQLYAGHVEEVNFHVVNDIIRRRTNLLVKRHTMGKVLEYLRTNSVWVNGPLATISANLFQTDCSHGSTQDRDGELFFQVHPTVRQRRLVPIPAVLFKSGFAAGYEPTLEATVVAFGRIQDTVSMIYVMPGHQSSISPSDSLDRLEKVLMETAISKNAWSNILTSLMDRPGMEVQLPRFSHRSFVNATLGLQKMGLKGLFKSDYADLGGLTGSSNRDIYLSDMIQINTFSTCGEEKIADHHHVEMYPAPPLRKRNKDVAAHQDDDFDSSEAIIDFGSLVQDSALGRGFYDDLLDPKYLEMPLPLRPRQARVPDSPRLRFDKPFLYFVRHNPTGMILFMGRFNPRLLP